MPHSNQLSKKCSLAVVNGIEVQVFDSLNMSINNGLEDRLRNFLNAIQPKNYLIIFPKSPQQNDTFNCGMFVYMYAHYACKKEGFDLEKISRKHLVSEIIKQPKTQL